MTGSTVQYILQPPILTPPLQLEATEAHSPALLSVSLCSSRGLFGPFISSRNPVSGQEGVTFPVAQMQLQEKTRDWKVQRVSTFFWSLVSYMYVLVGDMFAWLWSGGCTIGEASGWLEMKTSRPWTRAGLSRAEPGRAVFGRATLGSEELCVGREKEKKKRLVLWRLFLPAENVLVLQQY